MFEHVLSSHPLASVCERLQRGRALRLSGVWGSAAPLLAGAVGVKLNVPVLLVCTHLDDADQLADDLESLTGRSSAVFPAWELAGGEGEEATEFSYERASDETTGERLRLCRLLADFRSGIIARAGAVGGVVAPAGGVASASKSLKAAAVGETLPSFLVAPILALLQPVLSPQRLQESRRVLRVGDSLDVAALQAALVEAGFEHVESVDAQGEFAHRGGIVDIFPPGASQPVRIELFGDQVESIRYFDLDTQRSTQSLQRYDLLTAKSAAAIAAAETTHLLEYLPPETVVCFVEPPEIDALAQTFLRRLSGGGMFTHEQIMQAAGAFRQLEAYSFGPSGRDDPDTIHLDIRSVQRLEVNTEEALSELERLSREDEVWVYCETPAERERFMELLRAAHADLAAVVKTVIGRLGHGFHWPSLRLAAVGHHEIFHRYTRPQRLRRVRTGRPIDSFVDLEEGDYVVHVAHGIAKFDGLRTLDKAGKQEEYLTLRFAENALLHVPVTQIHFVQKYIGARKGHPTLSHLGGAAWAQRKARVAEAVKDMAAELLRVQAVRAHAPGFCYAGQSDWLREFQEEFVYTETEDQLRAAREIFDDMAQNRPMDRLLCGDVGYGKTELAMRAAFSVVEAGRQVAVLVPTTVLAAQHFRTFRERFADYPFSIDMISRFRSRMQQNEIVSKTGRGQVDILIGTHRLLSKDVQFKDLGLVVIDEEQRFGVEHKEHLKQLRETVEVLTLTATPIPRTLHMALLGLRDISNLTTPPLDRRSIYTEVCSYNEQRIAQGIRRELDREGQVFFVHNRVENIESVADKVRHLAPNARVEIGHGQMPEGLLEKTMLRFVRGDIDVLVCTTIIESGLDIPTANTMFINEADRLGLAQLHQLRGRIGRYKHRAYCYLLLPQRRPVNRVAAKRLKAVEEFSDLGAGFQIAMRDLEIRGAGNILGAEQSGHIAAVGYELYCRLLEQSVKQLRGEEVKTSRECHLELGIEAYIPRSYIASSRQRMEVYRRLALCAGVGAIEQLEKDMADAYGRVPPIVATLLQMAEIRLMAAKGGFSRIILQGPDLVFTLADKRKGSAALTGATGTVRMADDRTAHWRPPTAYLEQPTLLTVLGKQLRRVAKKG